MRRTAIGSVRRQRRCQGASRGGNGGAVAELEAVFQDFPEAVHVTAGGAGDVDEIDGDDA